MIDGKKLGEVGFQYLGVPYSEMDCQKFVEKCLADCGLKKDLPGSNAWYREVRRNGWTGTPEECKKQFGKIPTGAFLFILKDVSNSTPPKYRDDGIGDATHIGIVTDHPEGAIHSSQSNGCVCESKFSGKSIKGGWNRVGLWWPEVHYEGVSPTPEPEPTPEPDPKPQPRTAVVFAHTGHTVNIRRFPNIGSALVERVPVGETVDIIEYGEEWCKVKWKWFKGYMMTNFLVFDGDVPPIYYTVTIPGLSKEEAEEILMDYPNGSMIAG